MEKMLVFVLAPNTFYDYVVVDTLTPNDTAGKLKDVFHRITECESPEAENRLVIHRGLVMSDTTKLKDFFVETGSIILLAPAKTEIPIPPRPVRDGTMCSELVALARRLHLRFDSYTVKPGVLVFSRAVCAAGAQITQSDVPLLCKLIRSIVIPGSLHISDLVLDLRHIGLDDDGAVQLSNVIAGCLEDICAVFLQGNPIGARGLDAIRSAVVAHDKLHVGARVFCDLLFYARR